MLNFIKVPNLLAVLKNVCIGISKKANRKLELVIKNFTKFKKWRDMGLPMQTELKTYFGLQKVMDVYLFYKNFGQNIEMQHQPL